LWARIDVLFLWPRYLNAPIAFKLGRRVEPLEMWLSDGLVTRACVRPAVSRTSSQKLARKLLILCRTGLAKFLGHTTTPKGVAEALQKLDA
jgi:hypothetical protein